MKIWDTKYPTREEVFSGWMFAESPALSALDRPHHPEHARLDDVLPPIGHPRGADPCHR